MVTMTAKGCKRRRCEPVHIVLVNTASLHAASVSIIAPVTLGITSPRYLKSAVRR